MSVDSVFFDHIRIIRRTIVDRDSLNDWVFSETTGSEMDARVEEVSNDEEGHEIGDLQREFRRVYLLSVPAGLMAKDVIQVASIISPGAFSWSLNQKYEIISIEDAGSDDDHLQCFIKRVSHE